MGMLGKSWFMEMYRNKMATATTAALSKIVANHETRAGIYRESILLNGFGTLPIDAVKVDDEKEERLSGIDDDEEESELELDNEMDRDELLALLEDERRLTSVLEKKIEALRKNSHISDDDPSEN